ncbi:MAG: RNA polymerase sigma factor, partial [Bacteroidetes bacterium]|nr:RNA polymerase sigma factor [Bacteroidota bacterium]
MTAEQFQQLVLPHKNKLYRFALAYLDEANAKDIVQEVMLSAWEKIQDPRSVNNIEAWCMTLTRNKSLNMLKKKGRTYLQISEQYDLS